MEAVWYVIVSSGLSKTAPCHDEDEAWKKWERLARRAYGYKDYQMGTARAAHSPRLRVCRTRREAIDADISR